MDLFWEKPSGKQKNPFFYSHLADPAQPVYYPHETKSNYYEPLFFNIVQSSPMLPFPPEMPARSVRSGTALCAGRDSKCGGWRRCVPGKSRRACRCGPSPGTIEFRQLLPGQRDQGIQPRLFRPRERSGAGAVYPAIWAHLGVQGADAPLCRRQTDWRFPVGRDSSRRATDLYTRLWQQQALYTRRWHTVGYFARCTNRNPLYRNGVGQVPPSARTPARGASVRAFPIASTRHRGSQSRAWAGRTGGDAVSYFGKILSSRGHRQRGTPVVIQQRIPDSREV